MLTRTGDFDEWKLADAAAAYIPLYAKAGDTVVYVPYFDLPSQTKKFVKFGLFGDVWMYLDNCQ